MPHIFHQKHHGHALSEKALNAIAVSLHEDILTGTHKVSYRSGKKWDFEGCTENAPIDVSLAMPPHRPRLQPENHRTGMFLSSKSGPVRVKVCRHALNRPFHLSIAGGQSASTVIWVPSNFAGFITCAPGVRTLSFSAHFVEHVLPHARVNVPGGAPRGWAGDEIEVAASGRVVFRVWDVFAKTPEPDADGAQIQKRAGDVWRKVFGSPAATGEKCLMRTPSMSTWNWDFLIEDDEN